MSTSNKHKGALHRPPTALHMLKAAGWRGSNDELRRVFVESMRYVGAVEFSGEIMTADRLGQSPHLSIPFVDLVRIKAGCPCFEDWAIMKHLFWLRKHKRLIGAKSKPMPMSEFAEMVAASGYHETADHFLQEVIVHFQWWFPGMHDEAAMCHPRRLYAFVCDCQEQLRTEFSNYEWSLVLLKVSNMRKHGKSGAALAGDSNR